MNKKVFWYFLMTGAIALWIGAVALGICLSAQGTILGWLLLGIIIVIHASEIKTGLAIGNSLGLNKRRVVINTFIFGFTWWLPLKKGIIGR